MIKVFYGEDRRAAEREIERELGADYEVYEGRELRPEDLPNLFMGSSLFTEAEARKVVIKDLGEEGRVWELLPNYANSNDVKVIVWEIGIDKRTSAYKKMMEVGVRFREFPLLQYRRKVEFEILDIALAGDTERAIELVGVLEQEGGEPYMFLGLLTSQLVKKYRQGIQPDRMKKLIRELAGVDMLMKASSLGPWTAIRGFLAQIN